MTALIVVFALLAAIVAWVLWGERKGRAIDDAAESAYWRMLNNMCESAFLANPEKFKGSLRYERWKATGK